MTLDFLLTSLVVVVMPGAGVLYTLAFGLGQGARASVLAALGCTLGILPHILASTLGLAALLHTSAVLFQAVKLLGVVYLFYMAWQILRAQGALQVSAQKDPVASVAIVTNGFLLNILNPKLSIFFLAFLPLFVPANAESPSLLMLALGGVFMALTLAVFIVYGVFAAAARQSVISRPHVMKWLRLGFAGAFGLIGIRLLIDQR